ncbi:MAG: hypothetical protein HRU70_10080 [Phycisphaeraceae bacterium]|nr:MAG: hypothetical protein HRU70_10080 [Phycisphaeraceae bacterium]
MPARTFLILLAGVVLPATIPACATTREPRPADTAQAAPDRRLDVPYLPQLALPARALGLPPDAPAFRARLDDGRPITGTVVRLAAAPGTPAAVPPGAHPGWLPTLTGWTRVPLSGPPGQADIDVAILDIPTDAAGQGLWINDARIPLNWLPSSLTVATSVPWTQPHAQTPALDLRAAADAEATNPFRRWRARLALGTLAQPDDPPRDDRFPDDALERLAQIAEERWRVALAVLHADDPTLFDRVRARLTLMINVGDGRLAPAWPVLQADLDALQADLLDPTSNPQRRRGRVSRWLDALPVAVAWVASDAVSLSAANAAPFTRVLAANLSRADLPASVQPLSAFEPPQLARVPAAAIAAIDVPLPPLDEPSPAARTIALDASVGPWRARLSAAHGPIPASPPGVHLAPILRDWSLTTWSNAQPAPLDIDPPFILFLREPSDRPHTRRPIDGWALHVRFPPTTTADHPRTLHVWLGRQGAPEEIWRFTPDAATRLTPSQGQPDAIPPTRDPSGALTWRVPVSPAAAVAGLFPVAAVYTDHTAARFAFPRAMMPWDQEPGRVLIDPAAWGGVNAIAP